MRRACAEDRRTMPDVREMAVRAGLLLVLLLAGLGLGGTIGLIVLVIAAGLALFWLGRDGIPNIRRRRRP